LRVLSRGVSFAAIVEYAAHPPTLRCCGDEDRTTQARRRQALVRAMKAPTDVVIELGELSWADVSLMLDFVTLARRLRVQGHALALRDPQPQIAALLELVGLDRVPAVSIERSEPVYA
jgi:anti-anti-sigma regulatory factor